MTTSGFLENYRLDFGKFTFGLAAAPWLAGARVSAMSIAVQNEEYRPSGQLWKEEAVSLNFLTGSLGPMVSMTQDPEGYYGLKASGSVTIVPIVVSIGGSKSWYPGAIPYNGPLSK